jgi:hypothetical protein
MVLLVAVVFGTDNRVVSGDEEGFSSSHEYAILSLPTPFSTRLVQLTSEQRGAVYATGRSETWSLSPAAPAW